jgi:tetratricopeptide (TPR) repeat protein
MTAFNLRAALTAVLLSSAAMGAATLVSTLPAQAAGGVHAKVGNALKEAQSLAAGGNYKAAMAKVNEASAAATTSDETAVVNQMKQYIAVKSGDASIGGALGAKAKFANDANAGRWKDVIADGDILRKNNALDTQSQVVIAQAYYRQGDKQGCINYIKRNFGNGGGETVLVTLQRCAYDANDDETQRQALESLVASTGKAEYWGNLLKLSERAHGMNDHATLDVYRIKLLAGALNDAGDYVLLAQLALQLGFPSEAQAVLQKGVDAKVIPPSDRTNRLMNLAKTQAAADAANQAKAMAAAQSAPQGDALVKIGEDQIGQGKAKDAIATIQAGLAKPMKDKNNGQIRLGQAYLAAGQKDQAIRAFNAVKATGPNDKSGMIAHLYALAARR